MGIISLKLFLNSDQWFRNDVVYKISYLELWLPLHSTEQNPLCNFGRGHYGEHSCEIILNLDQCFRRCCLKKKFTHT